MKNSTTRVAFPRKALGSSVGWRNNWYVWVEGVHPQFEYTKGSEDWITVEVPTEEVVKENERPEGV